MNKTLAAIVTAIAISLPASAEAIAGMGYCRVEVPRTVTVRPGDTLSELAQTHLGDSHRYRDIAAYNGVADPNKIMIGQVLELPGKTRTVERLYSVTDTPSSCSEHFSEPWDVFF